MQGRKIKKGFTLVELVVVIAVIAILAGVSVGAYFGITESAKVSADTQVVTQLNTAASIYKVDNEIKDEEDLKEIINSTFMADNTFEDFVPQSANQGYHYWFKLDSQSFVLAKSVDLITGIKNKANKSYSFADKNIRSNLIDGYYLVDQKGSLLVDTINSLSNIGSGEEYQEVITDIKSLKNDKNDGLLGVKVENVFASTVYITNSGTYRYSNVEEVTNISFAEDLTNINTNIYLYDKEMDSLTYNYQNKNDYEPVVKVNEVYLPDSVTSIGSFSLHFVDENTKIYTNKSLDEVKQIFKAEASNATVVYLDENGEQSEILLSELDLVYSDLVGSGDYEVIIQSYNGKLHHVKGAADSQDSVFVAYDLKSFEFDVIFNENINVSTTDYEVEVIDVPENEEGVKLFSLENNRITLNYLPTHGANTDYDGIIRVTPVAGNTSKDIVITVVRYTYGLFTMTNGDGNTYQFELDGHVNETIELSYDGVSSTTYTFDRFEGFTNLGGSNRVLLDGELELASNGDVFNLVDGKLELTTTSFGTQKITAKFGDYLLEEFTINVVDNSGTPFETVFKNTDKYLYKLGNSNNVSLDSLFKLIEGKDVQQKVVSINIYDASKTSQSQRQLISTTTGNGLSASFASLTLENSSSWNQQTIKFNGEGVAIIEIVTQANSSNANQKTTELVCEIINGLNVKNKDEFNSALSQNINIILLNDFVVESTDYDNILNNNALFGNGFKIDASTVKYTGTNNSQHAFLMLNNAHIDNVIIEGGVFSNIGYSNLNKEMYIENIKSNTGDNLITNSKISGMKSAIGIRADRTVIENTTIEGGTLANIHLTSGELYLNDVTTVQTSKKATIGNTNKSVKGLGVVVESSSTNTKVVLSGYLRQNNWISENEGNDLGDYKVFFDSAFDIKYSKFHFNLSDDNTTRFINSGIAYKDVVSTPDDRRSAIEKENYPMAGESTVVSGTQFAVYSYISGAKFTSKDLAENIYTSNNSFTTKPLVNIKNYGAEPDANDTTSPYCYYKNNTLNIGVKPNDSYTINISDLVSITKYGRNIDFSLNVNGDAVINDKFITFDCTGTYLIDVNYSDNIIYDLLGNHTNITKDYTHSILAIVSNVEIPKPELIFDSEKVATAALHIADNDLYNKYVDLCDFYFAFKVLDCLSISYNGNTTSYSGSKSMPTGLTVAMSSYGQSIGGGNTYTKFGIVNDKDLVFHSDNKSNKIVSKDVKFTIQYKYAIEGITSVYKNVEFTLKKSSSVIKYSKYKSLTINSTHILNK